MEKLRGGVRFGEGVNTNLQAWYKAAVRVQVYIIICISLAVNITL